MGHCPRGRYLQVRGNVILISADLPHSIEKILPQEQDLFPVSFKRKLVYEGHFIEEIIDKNKVIAWFKWFKKNNPHFEDIELQSERIDKFSQRCRKSADEFEQNCQAIITEPDDEIEKEDMEEIPLSNQYPSIMGNKYEVELQENTITNAIADMILKYEMENEGEIDVDEESQILSDNESIESDESEEEIIPRKKTKFGKITVAPGEKGNFQNWGSDIFLEEKAFPHLFPYGKGGYLNICANRKKPLGFAQYCRNRIRSVDARFREDSIYIFFLLLIKEKVELKRCRETFLRQARKTPKLNKSHILEIKKETLERYNRTYSVFRNMRGTSMYYEGIKKTAWQLCVKRDHLHYF